MYRTAKMLCSEYRKGSRHVVKKQPWWEASGGQVSKTKERNGYRCTPRNVLMAVGSI